MSTENTADVPDTTDETGLLQKAYRTVTPGYSSHGDSEMDSIGWAMFLGMVVLFLPLLPFLLVVWLLTKFIDAVTGRGESKE